MMHDLRRNGDVSRTRNAISANDGTPHSRNGAPDLWGAKGLLGRQDGDACWDPPWRDVDGANMARTSVSGSEQFQASAGKEEK